MVGASIERNRPVCIYRKPFEQEVRAVFHEGATSCQPKQADKKGFVFAPFHADDKTLFLEASTYERALYHKEDVEWKSLEHQLPEEGKEMHLNLVRKGQQSITDGKMQKIVLSRKIKTEHQTDPKTIFVRLLETYSTAFCYLFFHPEVGTWMGATPETLLEKTGNTLKTMSLAGTLPFQDEVEPDWSAKETMEQGMVTQYIKDALQGHVAKLRIEGPKSVRAGKLWHLKTDIEGVLKEGVHLTKIVKLLHPTPAVCGLPVGISSKFILEHEGYNRKYYTGFLGEIGFSEAQSASLYVNLRCMEMTKGTTSIYVGGGITLDSVLEKEWEETQNKSMTMLRML